jgi:hypothetical protein
MKPLIHQFSLSSFLARLRPLPIAFLFALTALPSHGARENRMELPLILEEERARLRAGTGPTLSEWIYYEQVVIFGLLERRGPLPDVEPVGLHIDPTSSIRPERPVNPIPPERSRTIGSPKKNSVFVHWLAQNLAVNSNRHVLMSARLEKRRCDARHWNGSAQENVERFGKFLEEEGVEAKLLPDDAYVLLEAPGKERPFSYDTSGRPRAAIYEEDREAWLVRNKNYIPQGLIYQPTNEQPEDYPKRDIRVRHAAAALAKITGKEVFVQPAVEKREFEPLRTPAPASRRQ